MCGQDGLWSLSGLSSLPQYSSKRWLLLFLCDGADDIYYISYPCGFMGTFRPQIIKMVMSFLL